MRTTALLFCAWALVGCAGAATEGGDGDVTATWTAGDDEPLDDGAQSAPDDADTPDDTSP
jgi:hypothetical protein